MNFKKLPKEKQKHLLLVGLITVGALAGLGFGLVKEQYGSIERLRKKTAAASEELKHVQHAVQHAAETQVEMADARKALEAAETDVASGDLYAWFVNTLRGFKAAYKVEIPHINPVGLPGDVTLLADFPYKQAVLSLTGSAQFNELGRFLADFENRYPHLRIVNLTLDPSPAPGAGGDEALSFKFDIAAPVKVSFP